MRAQARFYNALTLGTPRLNDGQRPSFNGPNPLSIKRIWVSLCLVTMVGCSPTAQDQLARNAAKEAVRPVLAERFPGVPVEGATDCVIDAATSREILTLAADAVTGPTASTVEIVARIATRPEAIECLIREGAALALVMGNMR